MASQTPATSTLSPKLEQRIKEHKLEVARLREEFGDPAASIAKFMRERFTIEAILPEDWTPENASWVAWDDDSDDG